MENTKPNQPTSKQTKPDLFSMATLEEGQETQQTDVCLWGPEVQFKFRWRAEGTHT